MLKKIYVLTIFFILFGISCVLLCAERTKFSELEKREVKAFPELSFNSLKDGSFTTQLSEWFSDSQPFRDYFITTSLEIKFLFAYPALFQNEEEIVKIIPADTPANLPETSAEIADTSANPADTIPDFSLEQVAKIANAGIIIAGSGENVRAMMAFGGSKNSGKPIAAVIEKLHSKIDSSINIYCMVIPTAAEYYCPLSVKSRTTSQRDALNNIKSLIIDKATFIDVYDVLDLHKAENIYLRTDHHWAPLGAYYAAQKFALDANLPFLPLSDYQVDTISGYVGSMYAYSKDISVKKAPEDFIYYIPKTIDFQTQYKTYNLDENLHITSANHWHKGNYFHKFSNKNNAYCTFMGSDARITHITSAYLDTTSAEMPKRSLLILKDSFGNAIPSFLFGSFADIFVVDFRYFDQKLPNFIQENNITDILFAHNIFMACDQTTLRKYNSYL